MRIGRFNLDERCPAIMGIVNATPDSFSDGGRFLEPSRAIARALELESEGADIVDIGGESSRPGSEPVSVDEELRRVIPVIEGVRRRSSVPISIDTTKARVAARALDAGAEMINDISAARFDPRMLGLAADRGVPIALMHMKGTPRTMQEAPRYGDLMAEIGSFLADAMARAEGAGVARDRLIVDPGIGFGKTVEHNLTIIAHLDELSALKAPILIGTSRKAFIGKVLDLEVDERLEGTLATLAIAVDKGASILRVHDVSPARRFLDMYESLSG
ncbi:MAG: dihydropteroate synthase [Proteobacteria bacterium]|nr:dihydropteroate synthase [Pseudomonadota bacterium]